MANTILTPTAVTREALRILHQKLTFIGNINRQYDSQFAKEGAKIGSTLKIRLPNEYTVRTGRVMSTQDTSETSETLTVATQKGVDINFTSAELTLDLQDFSRRILDPAMSVLASNIESDALSMYKDIWQEVSDVGGDITFKLLLEARKKLVDSLTPAGRLNVCLGTEDNLNLVDALKGLFQDSTAVAAQYRDGYVGQTAGFRFAENTLLPIHTTGTDDGTGDYLMDSVTAQTGATLTVDTGAGTFKKGDVVSITGVNRVHPETKADTGSLMKFVITSDVSANATSIPISPSIVASGARKNVTNGAANDQELWKRESDDSTAVGASADYTISLAHHQDAFTFVSADLEMPDGSVDFKAREVFDGVSMRVVRQYQINDDTFPCRIDVLYGYKTIRQALACRLGFN